jgi:hypothetical protein
MLLLILSHSDFEAIRDDIWARPETTLANVRRLIEKHLPVDRRNLST